MLSQAEFFRQFNNDTKIEFNDALFDRDQDEIMMELMKFYQLKENKYLQ